MSFRSPIALGLAASLVLAGASSAAAIASTTHASVNIRMNPHTGAIKVLTRAPVKALMDPKTGKVLRIIRIG
jgi:hypothetical protein